jgi:hypothetical protein
MTRAWYVRARDPLWLLAAVAPYGATLSQRADGSFVEADAGVYRVAAVCADPARIEQVLCQADYAIVEREDG